MQLKMSMTATVRTNLSAQHLLAAGYFSRKVSEIEQANLNAEFGPFWEEILANSMATITFSVAALEAYINETFADREKLFQGVSGLAMSEIWELYEDKPVLDKFDFALKLKGALPYEKGTLVYQNVATLIKLRNALTHFHPEWDNEAVRHKRLSNQLTGKIEKTRFFENENLFPRGWANHTATSWAMKSVCAFAIDFETRSGLPKRMTKFAERVEY